MRVEKELYPLGMQLFLVHRNLRFFGSCGMRKQGRQVCDTEKKQNQLPGKKPPQVTFDSKEGNTQEHTENPDCQTDAVKEEGLAGFAQTVDDANQVAVGVEKRTDPGQSDNKAACHAAVENISPDETPGDKQSDTAE